MSLRLATTAGGRSLGSDATARCGSTVITVAGVFCQAPAGGVARVQVTFTSSVNTVRNASDVLVGAVDGYGSRQVEDRYAYPAAAGTTVDHLGWSPDPIAPAGSLGAGRAADAVVTAYSANDAPIPGVALGLLLGTVGGGRADGQCGSIPTTGVARSCTTGSDGAAHVTYHAPSVLPNGGSDALIATFGGGRLGPILQARDLYTFSNVVDHLVWSPDPVAVAGSLGRGGSAVVSLTAVDGGGQPVVAGSGGSRLFVSLRLATTAGGRSLGSDATARCGSTVITVAGVFCQAPAGGVARVQVTFTSSVNTVRNASDVLVGAVDGYGSRQVEDRYAYPAAAGTTVDHLGWSPDPIAPAGSLGAGRAADAVVTAYSANDAPIPGVALGLLLGTVGGGRADGQCGSIPTTGVARSCTTGSDGAAHVTYHAPSVLPNGGSDALIATFGGGRLGPILQARDLYTFSNVVDHLVWSPDPVAVAGSLGRGGSAVVSLTAVDGGGQPVVAGSGGLRLFVSLRLATTAGGRSLGSDATARCGSTVITVAGVFCQAPAGGVARVQVTFTSSVNTVRNASDVLVGAVDGYGSRQVEDRYAYPAAAGTTVDHLGWSPDPIAPAGSLGAGRAADAVVTAYSANDAPIPGVALGLLLGTVGGGRADGQCGSIPTTGVARSCTTGSDGAAHVTYHAPSVLPNGGSDALIATFGGGRLGPILQARDLYTFQ